MIVALIDNGSLEPAAHRNLRAVAAALAARGGRTVHAVSWKHSDRIPPEDLDGAPAWTLETFVRAMVGLGQREFVFVPFFISAQGAVGTALRRELDDLQYEVTPFGFTFAEGLAARDTIPAIAAARIRDAIAQRALSAPPVVVVDHGGPSLASVSLRNQLAVRIRTLLGNEISALAAASMEGEHGPLLRDQLGSPGFAGRDVVVAPLFLSPGRHAGPGGDIAVICDASPARCHVTELIGTHPGVVDTLSLTLRHALSQLRVENTA